MQRILHRITGIPYGQNKTRGNTDAPGQWTRVVIEQTKNLPKVAKGCIVRITYFLPNNKYPSDLPYGPDLDNLTKRLFDALNKTVFSKAKGKDSCVVKMTATKKKVESETDAGASIEITPVK